MKKLIVFFLVILVICTVMLGYLGVVPGISKYLAKPVDLGISADPLYTPSLEQKLNFKNDLPNGTVPSGRIGEFSGQVQVDEQVTSIAATSILAHWKKRSPSLPIRDVQVRFNPDGTAEVSGILEVSTAISIATTLGYSNQDIEKGKDYIKYVSGDLPFYVKGVGGITNNQVSMDLSNFQLGKVNVPVSITTQATRVIEDMIERRLKQVPSIDLESVQLNSGSLQFSGKVPSAIK